ncbi:MAG: DUF5994 family protein [Actinomycetota bacterium]|nr:DUF5994 family protein [Actinomycetota bacterium]
MTSDHTTNPDHVDAHNVANCDGSTRLSLKPRSSARGALDGAWWPRSTDPAIELAALIEELAAHRTPVRGIALARAGWDSAPRRIPLASGRKVAVDWFHTGHMIRIIDTNYQRIDLLIIPVDTTPTTADLVLKMATDGQDRPVTATGSHHFGPGCLPAKAQPSPGNDDGASDHRVHDRALDSSPSDVVGRRRVVLLPHGPAEQIDLPHPRSQGPSA